MSVAENVVNAVESAAKAVEGEVKTVAEAVVAEVKKAVVNIKAEEELVLRNAELTYLKTQMEMQRLQKIAEDESKKYQTYVEILFKTYGLDKLSYMFDGTVNAFKAIEKKL